jgi:Pretoxin HINT domain
MIKAMKMALHMVPLAGAIDHALDGNYWDAGVSLLGDVSLVSGFGAIAAARGITCVHRQAQVVRFLNTTAMATEGAAMAIQIGRGFHAMYTGDTDKAWSFFGDATLRLLGLSAQAIAWLRNRPLCFVAGTPVHTDSGLRPIEQVRVGERVWAYDRQAQQWRLCPVTDTFERTSKRLATVRLHTGEELTGTDGHPFWVIEGTDLASRPGGDQGNDEPLGPTPGRWVAMAALRAGDVVLAREGRVGRIIDIATRDQTAPVYNLEVAGLHSYAVGQAGVLVHNGDGEVYNTGRLARNKVVDRTKPSATAPKADKGPAVTKAGGGSAAGKAPAAAGEAQPATQAADRLAARVRANSDPRVTHKWEIDEVPDVNGKMVKYRRGDLETTPELQAALQAREDAVKKGLNPNQASKDLGELGAEQYMTKQLGATRVPKPANTGGGQYDLDQVYKLGDTYYIVEAKGGRKAQEIARKVEGETVTVGGVEYPAEAIQGSKQYLEMTLADMAKDGSPTQVLAEQLQIALAQGKVKYINVRTIPKGAGKASFSVKHYKI